MNGFDLTSFNSNQSKEASDKFQDEADEDEDISGAIMECFNSESSVESIKQSLPKP
jgi:hypothetical protein